MIKSIKFRVKQWQHNPNAILIKLHTDAQLATHPLRKAGGDGKAEGLCFVWTLVIQANGIEVLFYSTEEFFIIPNREITDSRLEGILKESYDNSKSEVEIRNIKVGLNASFPSYKKIPIDLPTIRNVLDM